MPLRKGIKVERFQELGARFAIANEAVLIGDEMGLGKTLQALIVADRLNLNTLIVCPAYLKENWAGEIRKFLVNTKARFTLASYEDVKQEEEDLFGRFELLIVDECQYLKTMSSDRTRIFHENFKAAPPKRFIALSGTPIDNRVTEFFSILKLLSMHPTKKNGLNILEKYKSQTAFSENFARSYTFTVNDIKMTKYFDSKNIPELKKYLDKKYIRREAKNELDLPPLRTKIINVDIKKIAEIQEQLEEDYENAAARTSVAKAQSALYTAPFTANYVEDLVDQTGSCVVFTDHVEASKDLFLRLSKKYLCRVITGETPVKLRQPYVKEFQEGKVKVLICSIQAAGVGFTMTRARHVVFNDIAWTSGKILQAIKRIHRIGQANPCTSHIILSSEISRYIYKAVKKKELELKRVL